MDVEVDVHGEVDEDGGGDGDGDVDEDEDLDLDLDLDLDVDGDEDGDVATHLENRARVVRPSPCVDPKRLPCTRNTFENLEHVDVLRAQTETISAYSRRRF